MNIISVLLYIWQPTLERPDITLDTKKTDPAWFRTFVSHYGCPIRYHLATDFVP